MEEPLIEDTTHTKKTGEKLACNLRHLISVCLLDLAITSWCFMWPERDKLHFIRKASTLKEIYDFDFSTLDVWIASVIRNGLLTLVLLLLWNKLKRSRFGAPLLPIPHSIETYFGTFETLSYACLFAKFLGLLYGIFKRQEYIGAGKEFWIFVSVFSNFIFVFFEFRWSYFTLDYWRQLWASSISLRCPLLYEEYQSKEKIRKEKRENERRALSSIWKLAKVDGNILGVAFLCGCVASMSTVLISFFIGKIVRYAAHDRDHAKLESSLVKLLFSVITCSIFTAARGGLFTLSCARLNQRVRSKLFNSLIYMEQGYFDTVKTGELSSRLNADTSTMSNQISLNINVLVRSIVQILFTVGIMLWTTWKLTLVTFAMVPLSATIAQVYGRFYRKITKKTQTSLADASAVAEEALSSMSTVKSMASEDFVEAAYGEKLVDFLKLQIKESAAYSLYASLTIFCPNAAMLATLAFGSYMALHNEIQGDDLYSFILYQQTLGQAFSNLGDIYSGISAALGAAEKVFELIDREPTLSYTGTLTTESFKGHISLDEVTFRYPGRLDATVLDNFTLKISSGEVVALVGPSGSGKSSIIKLIERLYEPEKGSVSLDGRNIAEYDRKWLCSKMALVGQEPVLFACSIKENIMYGLEGPNAPTMDEIIRAAKCANAHEFIVNLSDGYNTTCGEKGMQLSGGQKQRIAIARAIVRNPSILLLDEATSALDAESERVVQEAIDNMISLESRTVVVVAHRLSTIQNSNKIVVINKGNLEENGTHEELIGKKGMYYKLVCKQLQGHGSSSSLLAAAT